MPKKQYKAPPNEPPHYQPPPPPQQNGGPKILPPPPPQGGKEKNNPKHYPPTPPPTIVPDNIKSYKPQHDVGKYYQGPIPTSTSQPPPSGEVKPYPPPPPPHYNQPPQPQQPGRTQPAVANPPMQQNGKISDEEMLRMGPHELLKRLRRCESESMRQMMEHGQSMREAGRRIQAHVVEIRALKDVNQRLQDDNQELRDLCCFLDDDRQKGRKLAREWQRFGRYTASVMRQEVSAYQAKLRQLDTKQQELIKDNLELKELCLYLDEERNQSVCSNCGGTLRPGPRDDGDGSSSSTNADEPTLPAHFAASSGMNTRRTESRERLLEESIQRQRSLFNDQILQYIRNLEEQISTLKTEKQRLMQKLGEVEGDRGDLALHHQPLMSSTLGVGSSTRDEELSRPEAVVQALRVLEVREHLELPDVSGHGFSIDDGIPDMDDGEKALVMEMCNVVWRKLEGTSGQIH